MVIGYCITGVASAALLAAMAFVAGYPLWSVFLLYMFGGTLGIAGLAMFICLMPRNVIATNDLVTRTP